MAKDLIMGVVWLLFAASMFISTFGYRDVGSLAAVGPAYWPRFLLGGMILLALLSIARTLLRNKISGQAQAAEADGRVHPNLFWVTGGLTLVYTLAMPYLGFLVATIGFLLAMLWAVRIRGYVMLPTLSVGFSLLLVALFAKLMSVPLPRGEGIFRSISLWLY